MDYTGYLKINFNEEELSEFYTKLNDKEYCNSFGLKNNQYLLLAQNEEIIDKYYFYNNSLEKVSWRPFNTALLGKIKPLNDIQELGFHMLQSSKSTLKIFDSDYGVGKSFLCTNYILDQLHKGKFDKAILIRPNIGLEDYPSLGSIPGDYLQKSLPWFGMFSDIVGSPEIILDLIQRNKLELAPMETLRGRSFSNSIIYVEECGNLTTAACRLIVSRCGENSEILMCGDQSQTDKKRFRQDNGLAAMRDSLVGNELVSYLKLEGCVRSKTAQLCELF